MKKMKQDKEGKSFRHLPTDHKNNRMYMDDLDKSMIFNRTHDIHGQAKVPCIPKLLPIIK